MTELDLIEPAHSFVYAGTRVNIYHANKGKGLPRHEHLFSHATFCCSGSVIIRKEKTQLVIDKTTQPINLLSNEWHELEAAEDGTVFVNVFAESKY